MNSAKPSGLDGMGSFSRAIVFLIRSGHRDEIDRLPPRYRNRILEFERGMKDKERARQARKSPISVSKWCQRLIGKRMSDLMRGRGPIPAKRGAGTLTEYVELDSSFACDSERSQSAERMPRSYKYSVYDHCVIWYVKRGYELREVDGHVVAIALRDLRRVDEPVLVRVATKGPGYSGRWDTKFMFRGKLLSGAAARKIMLGSKDAKTQGASRANA